jgi:hypothetical protein
MSWLYVNIMDTCDIYKDIDYKKKIYNWLHTNNTFLMIILQQYWCCLYSCIKKKEKEKERLCLISVLL